MRVAPGRARVGELSVELEKGVLNWLGKVKLVKVLLK